MATTSATLSPVLAMAGRCWWEPVARLQNRSNAMKGFGEFVNYGAADSLSQRLAYAPDAFLREPERDLRFSFFC
jgi:hypothetical protein